MKKLFPRGQLFLCHVSMDDSMFGFAAALLTTVSFLPQVYKTWKTGDTSGISLVMYSIFVTGISCWLVYGYRLDSRPMMLANSVTLVLSGSIWWMKARAVVRERKNKGWK